MKKIKLAGYTIAIKHREGSTGVIIFKGEDKLPMFGTILYGSELEAEKWAVSKLNSLLFPIPKQQPSPQHFNQERHHFGNL